MSDAKTVQIQLDRPRNWRFTTGARIRLCDRLNVPDGLQEIINVLGTPEEDESKRLDRLKGKDAHEKLVALIWCGQIPSENPLSYDDLLEVTDDATIMAAMPQMMEGIQASMGNPTPAPEQPKPALETIDIT